MTESVHQPGQERLARAQQVLDDAARESERIQATLERSRKVRERALPVLRRAGYLR